MRQLHIRRDAIKMLNTLPAKQYRQVVSRIFDLLKDPSPHYSKPLQGSEYYRIAAGEYRVVYRWDEASVQIITVGKRNDAVAYRQLLH